MPADAVLLGRRVDRLHTWIYLVTRGIASPPLVATMPT
jgi:hypothetical protein